jgi:alkylation response protein AidB-like acyl-CoA dehydrogenase
VDFRPSADQEALQAGVRSFCAGRVPADALADLAKRGGFDRALWGELAGLGVLGLRLPEGEGGLGLGCADAVLVFEELGRRVVPGPLLWSHLAAGLVPGAATGEVVVGGIDAAAPPLLVEHLDALDVLLVLREGGVFRVDPRALRAEPVEQPLDPLTPLHHVRELPEGERVAGADAEALRRVGAALAAAELLGIAVATQELATAYAKQREQFGRPIGSFQAIKHLLADAFVRQEAARAAVYAAGALLDDPGAGDAGRAVHAAKLVAGEAALRNARTCIQVHGGMGYTWEVPAHFYLKRCWVLESAFGTGDAHAGALAGRL